MVNCAGLLVQGLFDVHYPQPPYATTFPEITDTLSFRPCVPVRNIITDNTFCNVGVFLNSVGAWNDTIGDNYEACPP